MVDLSLNVQSLAWSNRANLTLTKPTGTVAGDVLLFGVGFVTGLGTPPAGLTLLGSVTMSGGTIYHAYYWRRVDGTDGASYAWTNTARNCGGAVWRFSGMTSSDPPFDATPSVTACSQVTFQTVTSPSQTTTKSFTAVVQMLISTNYSSITSTSLPQIWAGASQVAAGFGAAQTLPGATGDKTINWSTINSTSALLATLKTERPPLPFAFPVMP